MVSSGQISSDLSTMTNTLNQYDSAIDGLSGVWKGDSYNNLVSKANEFLSSASKVINSQMTSFQQAISSYEKYKELKNQLAQLVSLYNSSSSNNSYGSQIESLRSQLTQLKSEIESILGSITEVLEGAPAASTSEAALSSLSSGSSGPIEYHVDRYTGQAGNRSQNTGTTVWWALIPKNRMPNMAMARDDYTTVQSERPTSMAKRHNAALGINISVTHGIMYTENTLVRGNEVNYGETLYMTQDGTLNSVPNSQYSTDDILALNPVWAAKGFFAIARDGQFISNNTHDDAETSYICDQRHPRTFIGQDSQGNYIVGVCGGRAQREQGMYMEEIYDFVQQNITSDIKFLYNGDGGGSSAFVVDGQKLNITSDSNEERARPNLIYWT